MLQLKRPFPTLEVNKVFSKVQYLPGFGPHEDCLVTLCLWINFSTYYCGTEHEFMSASVEEIVNQSPMQERLQELENYAKKLGFEISEIDYNDVESTS